VDMKVDVEDFLKPYTLMIYCLAKHCFRKNCNVAYNIAHGIIYQMNDL